MSLQFVHLAACAVRVSVTLVCCIFVLTVMISPTVARAEYRLSIGDKVRVHVFGQQELDQSATVDDNGKLWVPTVGHIQAAGHTLQELHTSISSILTANEIIRAEDINVEVIEFRPFYIDGTVANAGSYPYRVGLTVRQAIALAGGFAQPAADQNYLTNLANLVGQRVSYQSLWSQYIERHARVARLRTEIEGRDQFDWTPPSNLPASASVVRRIRELEEKHFKARAANVERQKVGLDRSLKISADEVDKLQKQGEREADEYKVVSERLSRLKKLQAKGVLRAPRVASYEITVFLVRSRFNNTGVQLVRAKRAQQELTEQREQLEIARREELTRELQTTLIEMDALHSQMIASANGLLQSNAVIQQACTPKTKEGIFIHRQEDGQKKRFRTSEDGDVLAGDVIEVNIVNEVLRGQCASQAHEGEVSVHK